MLQIEYDNIIEKIAYYKKNMYIMDDTTQEKNMHKYIMRLERMLADEYKYGTSLYEYKLIQKYINKCENLVNVNVKI